MTLHFKRFQGLPNGIICAKIRWCVGAFVYGYGKKPGRQAIHIEHLSLTNFRNYQELELNLKPGMTFFQGDNGQGKSNLLEAAYILAIAKSPRASSDREVVRWQSAREGAHAQIAAVVQREDGRLKIQVDLQCLSAPSGEAEGGGQEGPSVQKRIRVNGIPRLASELVGEMNAVMFSAQDIQLVHGSPSLRRKYLDILISQLDHLYLRAIQRYQRLLYQRNHLLRGIRNGRAQDNELHYWDNELVTEGKYVIARRSQTVQWLGELAGPVHRELAGNGEGLDIVYKPSVGGTEGDEEGGIAVAFRQALEAQRRREISQGVTLSGPHRDDLQLLVEGMDAGPYASRGQARTIALSMKLAEACYLAQRRGQGPVLLLDDVLSELDATRRSHVLANVSQYQQCLITTTDMDLIGSSLAFPLSKFLVDRGRVEPLEV